VRRILAAATEEVIAEVPDESPDKAVEAAVRAYPAWSAKSPAERSTLMFKWAALVERDLMRLALLESSNTGKPIKLARDGDIPFAIDNLRFFAGAARPENFYAFHLAVIYEF
jgi:betaine-aldehyde dehydrogenase